MKTFKLIAGVILAIAAINTMVLMGGEEQGAGLAGAITGFIILGGLAIWLITSALNTKKQ